MGKSIASLGIKTPWYPEKYLYSMKARFPEFKNYTREDLFQVLYENVDRESPVYEEEFDVAMEVYTILNNPKLSSADDRLLHYLFNDLPAINAQRIKNTINDVTKEGSCHLVLGTCNSKKILSFDGFSTTMQNYKLRFSSRVVFNEIQQSLKQEAPFLVLSITKIGNSGSFKLTPQLIQFPSSSDKNGPILNKELSVDEFIEIFNNADLAI